MCRRSANPAPGPWAGGFSLIELVIVIVVLGIGVVALLSSVLQGAAHSADPMVAQQANAIARSYLEEVLLKSFCDPNDFSSDCPSACVAGACGACSGGTVDGVTPEDRATFDDVCDYHGLADNAGAVDQTGSAIPGLEGFNVAISVDSGATLNGLSGALGQVLRVDVSVSHDTLSTVRATLSAYRSNY